MSGGTDNDYLSGSDGDDTLDLSTTESAGYDRINGGYGNDTIVGENVDGGPGTDHIWGSDGNDNLKGGSGTDTLYGQPGDDKLDGGPSPDDYCDGGDGDDTGTAGCETMIQIEHTT